MNHRLMTAGLGLLITLLGIAGLVAPDRVMAFLGFTILNAGAILLGRGSSGKVLAAECFVQPCRLAKPVGSCRAPRKG